MAEDMMSKQDAIAALGISRYKFDFVARELGITYHRLVRDMRIRLYARADVEHMREHLNTTRSGSSADRQH